MNIKILGKVVYDKVHDNSHVVLGSVTAIGVVVTSVTAYMLRPKIDAIVKETKKELKDIPEDDTESRKKVKRKAAVKMAKAAAPTVLAASVTIGAAVGEVAVANKKIEKASSSALANAIAYDALFEKTKKLVGDDKAEELQNEVKSEKGEVPTTNTTRMDIVGFYQAKGGCMPFQDSLTGQLFLSDCNTILNVCLRLNDKLVYEPYVEVSEWLEEMDLPESVIAIGMCWYPGKGLHPRFEEPVMIGDVAATKIEWDYEPQVNFDLKNKMAR